MTDEEPTFPTGKNPISLGLLALVVGSPLALHAIIFFVFIYPEKNQLGDSLTLIFGITPVIIAAAFVLFFVIKTKLD